MRLKIWSPNNVMSLTVFQNDCGTNAGMHLTICLNTYLCCWAAAGCLTEVRCSPHLTSAEFRGLIVLFLYLSEKYQYSISVFSHVTFSCLNVLIHVHKLFKWDLIHLSGICTFKIPLRIAQCISNGR